MRAWLTPDTPSGDTVRRVLHIPVEYLASVNGALEQLTEETNWEQYGAETPEQAAERMNEMMEAYYVSHVTEDTAQRIGSIPPSMALAGSSVLDLTLNQNYLHNGYFSFDTPADNNHIDYILVAPDGYLLDLAVRVSKGQSFGILYARLDGTNIGGGNFDLYNSTIQRNQIAAFTNEPVVGDGEHSLTLHIIGKNPSSSGYDLQVNEILYRLRAP
jgi:hypothetical protein